ncbi:MAG TPA: nitrogenase iron protein NifH [Patescibacteria group bacterium]|nr:nitrogenase iron protein NifH [Patescibacteria group bacterium]
MKKIAFYGKGGIGKSTTTANVAAALAQQGYPVCQIGCDPKNDSTRTLLGRSCPGTVLDLVRKFGDEVAVEELVHSGFAGVRCVEAGGPEPGVGCAGRGIIVALEKLKELQALPEEQITLYDVLGDVVCGGFAVPIREGYATDIYIVSSGELMSLYAANNIAKGVARFAGRSQARLRGIIGNSRNLANEQELLAAFAERLNTRLLAFLPWDRIVQQAEIRRKTVIEWAPETDQAEAYRRLADQVMNNDGGDIPTPMEFADLEELVLHYGAQ